MKFQNPRLPTEQDCSTGPTKRMLFCFHESSVSAEALTHPTSILLKDWCVYMISYLKRALHKVVRNQKE